MVWLRRIAAFVRLSRPLFLTGGFLFYGLGVAVALYEGAGLSLPALLLGQLVVTAAQLMTHYSNDYFDLAADRANPTPTRWSGGSRVLAEGALPPAVALAAALVCAAVAVGATAVLAVAYDAGPRPVVVLLLAVGLAWAYSAPPFRLHSRGLGEAAVALIIPVLTPLAGYTLQTDAPVSPVLLAVAPLTCLQATMILAVNFPDAAGDRRVGKRTLVLRLGPPRAARVYAALLGLAYLSLPLVVALGLPAAAAVALLVPLPLAVWLAWRVRRGAWDDPQAWSGLAFWTIGLLMLSAGLELAVFLWLVLV